MLKSRRRTVSRRQFLSTAAISTAVVAAPTILTAARTDRSLVVGEGEHKFEIIHDWPQLPDKFTWQTTHNVAVDKSGCVYVIHEGRADQKDHPSIFVFDPDGKYMRSFGSQFQGGGHGIEIREEGRHEFLYVCAYQHLKTFAKMDLMVNTLRRSRAMACPPTPRPGRTCSSSPNCTPASRCSTRRMKWSPGSETTWLGSPAKTAAKSGVTGPSGNRASSFTRTTRASATTVVSTSPNGSERDAFQN